MSSESYSASRELIATLPEQLPSSIADWWLAYARQDRNLEREAPFTTSPLDGLLDVVLQGLSGVDERVSVGFRKLVANPQADEEATAEHAAASILMGQAVADALRDSEGLWWDVGLAELVFEYNQAFTDAFEQRVVEHLAPEAPHREGYIRKFLNSDGWREERAVFSPDRRLLKAEIEAWNAEVDPYQIWKFAHHPLNILSSSVYPIVLLLRADAPEWAQAFDTLPLPSAKFALLRCYDDDLSLARFRQLMETAAPIFDESGGWTKAFGITAGLVGLYHLFQPSSEPEEGICKQEIRAGLADVFRTLCTRGAWGVSVLLDFQKYLIGELRSSLRRPVGLLEPIVLESATLALAEMGPSNQIDGWHSLLGSMLVEEIRSPEILREGIAERQWRSFCSLCSLNAPHALDEELASWLAEYSSDGELGWLGQWAGRALAWAPQATECWEKSWRELWFQREVAWHRHEHSTPDPLLGSVALIEAGLGALLWKASPLSNKPEFWKRLVSASIFLWHRRPDRRMAVPERTILRCVGYAPFVFEDDLQDHVAYLIECLGSREPLLIDAAQILCQNGMKLPEVIERFRNCEVAILELTENEIDWAILTRPHDVASLAKFRDELSGLV